jgi:methionyl-tRNA formyltransferase
LINYRPRNYKSLGEDYDLGLPRFCSNIGVPLIQSESYDLGEFTTGMLAEKKFDLGFSYGWQRIIPADILACFEFGVFGWHATPFLLPNGIGRSPLNWSIRLGLTNISLYCFRYSNEYDRGDGFRVTSIKFGCDTYISNLYQTVYEAVKLNALELISELVERRLQLFKIPSDKVSLVFPKLTPEDSEFDPSVHCVDAVLRLIRASSSPFDGAFFYFTQNDLKYKLTIFKAVRSDKASGFGGSSISSILESKILPLSDGQIRLESFTICRVEKLR